MFFLLLLLNIVFAAPVHLLKVDGGIDPGTADYIVNGIQDAENAGAEAVLIELDTPGGLLQSTRQIVQAQLNSKVPVIVYVTPSGARAGSAGVFITMAAHVAVMAPATTIGAAHPVSITGEAPEKENPMNDKILNDTVSWAKAIAMQRGRSAEWAEKAVRESVSIESNEALTQNVVDLIAASRSELLAAVEGRKVKTIDGEKVLQTKSSKMVLVEMTFPQRVTHFLGDPNILFFLLTVGALCLYVEFKNPGGIVPGFLGIVLLIGGGIGLSILSFNIGGLILIILGFAAVIMEAYTSGFGIWALIGAVCLVFGGALLFEIPGLDLRVEWSLLLSLGVSVSLLGAFLGYFAAKAHMNKVQMGEKGMIDQVGVVSQGGYGSGRVKVHGEDWSAEWFGEIESGAKVRVSAINGLKLHVEKLPESRKEQIT